jgi:hypothetical protein
MKFQNGDIIIEYDDSEDEAKHALLWVDDAKAKNIVHSKDVGTLLGVVQQSVGALRNTDEDIKYLVYRHESSVIADYAAMFAIKWATRSDDPMVNNMVKYASTKGQSVSARNRFGRRGDEFQTCEDWSPQSLVRAVRAWHRSSLGNQLSRRKGVSCSQFVTYCYQAASLHATLHMVSHSNEWWRNFLLGPNSFVSLKKENRYDVVYDALVQLGPLKGVIPPAMLVDAKTTDAENLQNCLERGESGFACIGEVVVDNWQGPTMAWVEDEKKDADKKEG